MDTFCNYCMVTGEMYNTCNAAKSVKKKERSRVASGTWIYKRNMVKKFKNLILDDWKILWGAFLVFILKITSDRILSYITYHDMQKFDITYSNRWYHIYIHILFELVISIAIYHPSSLAIKSFRYITFLVNLWWTYSVSETIG